MESTEAASRGTRLPVILGTFILVHFSHHLCTAAAVPLLPMIRDSYGLDYLQAGLLLSAFSVTYGIAQLPMAMIADRLSKRRIISLGLLGVGASCLGVGLSTDYTQLLVALVLMGIAGATYHAPASAFLSQAFPKSQLGRSYGMHIIGGTGGMMAAPLVAILVANATGSWRNAFLLMGMPIFVGGILFWRVMRVQERANVKAAAGDRSAALGVTQVLRLLGALVIINILTRLLATAMNSFLPLYLVDKHDVPRDIAGLTMSVLYASEVVGAPLGGALSDRFGRKPVLLFSVIMMGPLMLLVSAVPFGLPMVGALVVYGVFVVFRAPALESLMAETIPIRQRATVLGAYHFLAQESSGISTPMFGFVMDRLGPSDGFTSLAALAACFSALVLLLWKKL